MPGMPSAGKSLDAVPIMDYIFTDTVEDRYLCGQPNQESTDQSASALEEEITLCN